MEAEAAHRCPISQSRSTTWMRCISAHWRRASQSNMGLSRNLGASDGSTCVILSVAWLTFYLTAKQSDLAGGTARNLPFWQVIRLGENLTFPVIAMAILLTASHCSGAASAGDRARELEQATAARTGSARA